jgi:hypothetical protein
MDVTGTTTWEDAHAPEPEYEPIAPDPPEGWEPDDEAGTVYDADVINAYCHVCGCDVEADASGNCYTCGFWTSAK